MRSRSSARISSEVMTERWTRKVPRSLSSTIRLPISILGPLGGLEIARQSPASSAAPQLKALAPLIRQDKPAKMRWPRRLIGGQQSHLRKMNATADREKGEKIRRAT